MLGAVVTSLTLAACVGSPAPSATPSTPSSSPSRSARPAYLPEGTAKQNLAYFDDVNTRLIARGGELHGRDFIDNLVAAGFAKADMEVTPDTTSAGLVADNIQFSVKVAPGRGCLIGQYGNVGYTSIATEQLGTGRCLVGKTRTIDW